MRTTLHRNIFTGFSFKLFALIFCTSLSLITSAQTPRNWNSSEILLHLKKLNVLGSVLYIAAHPDDENTRLLSWLSNEKLYRTGYMSITRGDGGQNLIGDEQGVELGLIRTQELLSARRIDGAEQFFSRAYDFGFSKSTNEALEFWNKEKILSDVVWVIRNFQPDVIITRFPEDARAGHGQHSASAVLAREGFIAAADPNRFPEQLKYGLKPWQAKRIMWNTFNFGGANTQSDDQLKIDVGGYNPLLGKSYGELAADSRSQHKSQGFGVPSSRGYALEYFKTTLGGNPQTDLMDSVTTNWNRVAGGKSISKKIDDIIKKYSFSDPGKSVPALVKLYQSINKLEDSYWKRKKLKEVEALVKACSGLYLEASTQQDNVVQGDSLKIDFSITNRGTADVAIKQVSLEGTEFSGTQTLSFNKNVNFSKTILVPSNRPISQPYWLEQPMDKASYVVNDQLKIGKPENDPSYQIQFTASIAGQDFVFLEPLLSKSTDPVKGELFQPVAILPPYSVHISPEVSISHGTGSVQKIFTSYKANNPISTSVMMTNGEDHAVPGVKDSFVMRKGEVRTEFENWNKSGTTGQLQNNVSSFENGSVVSWAYKNRISGDNVYDVRTIRYDHIPRIVYFKKAKATIENFDWATDGKRIGYIMGAGDKVPEALGQMGYEVSLLGENDLNASRLKQFDAVVTGVRAYNVHDWLEKYFSVLMDYVNNGGNLLVQYNTSSFFGGGPKLKIGPYDFNLSRNRVTDENAKVNFLVPEDPVLNWPNKITDKDFSGWIQERGIYFADQLDSKYRAILGMNDPGEKEMNGSLIVADYGKGRFIYTGLVFFRELPAGVPGAYRLFANLVANPNHQSTNGSAK
ncbi:MAG: PIG-L family deacetylase [Bacteroidetes bacterium]|nr:MAG: PIG-L family deacetylase [Bacteroidota bacterium]